MIKAIVGFVFFLSVLFANAQVLINSLPTDKLDIATNAKIAQAGQTDYTIQQIATNTPALDYKPLATIEKGIGFTNHHYWVTFTVQNNTAQRLDYFLETARPITDVVDLYTIGKDGQIQQQLSGDAMPFAQRPLANPNTVFPLSLNAGETYTYYLHLKSDGEVLNVPLILYTPNSFIETNNSRQLIFGFFYGILLLAAITYLFFYVALRDISFLYYGGYVIFIALLQFSLDGLFYQHIMPGSGWLYRHSLILTAIISTIFMVQYVVSFLNIKQNARVFYKIYLGITALLALIFVSVFMGEKGLQYSYPLANIVGLVMLVVVIANIIYFYVQKIKVDVFFVTGIICLVAGYIIFILNNFGVLNSTFVTMQSAKLGTGLEIIFLSLSMSNRIRKLRSDKEKMQEVALQKSEEANELKTYFMSNMSHELRTPLNAIMGLADVMVKEVTDQKFKNNLEIIKYASVGLLSSVNDVLDYSKIEKGELVLDNTPFDVTKTLTEIINSAALHAHDKKIEFNIVQRSPLPFQVFGDSARLGQIVNNVVSNAVKFTPAGSVSVAYGSQHLADGTILIKIEIEDTGVGIPKDKLDYIFDSFSQESINNKRKFGGMGLGLAIVKNLVDLHRGTITINSQVGMGTRCTIVLPFTVAEIEKTITKKYPRDEFNLLGAKILVVEDNDVNQFIMQTILSRWKNTEIKIVGDGSQSLDALKEGNFDIVLMDLQMPVMDGYEATKCIRAGQAGDNNTSIPIIAVTADTMETTKQTVLKIGMNAYMAKPINQEHLYEMMADLMEKRSSNAA